MSDLIKLLPDAIANQIAAGEVVQRPASVIKELLENAVDAGSTKIQVIITDAGKSLIQVVDNGIGMSPTDARMCLERHATSKIRKAEDLFNIRTMGFRGEAIASVAAISHFEIKTRRAEDELGSHILVEGSEVKNQESCQTPIGTSISVKNLFYNVPARRNFLKSNPVETRHILDEFTRVALAFPDIHFILHQNGLELFHLPKSNLRQRIVQILGKKKYNERLVPINEETDILRISGFVGKPEYAKKTRGEQFFFVNNRFIKSAYLNHAVTSAYSELLSKDNYPMYAIYIDIDSKNIDINVHPTKQEIKFGDERIVYTFINASVRHALGQYSITPTLDFKRVEGMNCHETWKSAGNVDVHQPERSTATNFDHQRKFSKESTAGWKDLYEISQRESTQDIAITIESDLGQAGDSEAQLNFEDKTNTRPIQIHQRYILSQIRSGLLIIDQQAAHERILYETYIRNWENKKSPSQKSLFPEKIDLNTADAILLKDILKEISHFGYDIQEFGENTFIIHGKPADIWQGAEQGSIERILEQYKSNSASVHLDKRQRLARSLAWNNCIKKGVKLSEKEMSGLIDELFASEKPYLAVNGTLTFVTYSLDRLSDLFIKKQS